MLPLLTLLVAAQIPAVPGESTLVSFCKQRRLSSCQELAKINPGKAAEIEADFAKAALSQQVLKAAEEEAREEEDAKAEESSEAEASDEPPNCKGQEHHIISRPISKELEKHEVLRGLYRPRDERFKIRAREEDSHCGYQKWHREVDEEVIQWLRDFPRATPKQFMKLLREIYNRPEMRKRFPSGL